MLINYIPEPIRKSEDGFKDKDASPFKTNTPKQKQKESAENIIKSIRNLFILKTENKALKDGIIRDIRTLFEQEDDYYKPIKVRNFWNNNHIEYESNGDRNENVLLKEYFGKIKPYLKDIIIDLQKSGDCISSKDADEERVMHSKSENT